MSDEVVEGREGDQKLKALTDKKGALTTFGDLKRPTLRKTGPHPPYPLFPSSLFSPVSSRAGEEHREDLGKIFASLVTRPAAGVTSSSSPSVPEFTGR